MQGSVLTWMVIFIAPWAFAGWLINQSHATSQAEKKGGRDDVQEWIVGEVSSRIRGNEFPKTITNGTQNYQIEYTLNDQLQHESERLLSAYKPDFGAIVVIEARTGKIRAMASYERGALTQENLAMRGTFPAASIFKMVTASAAIDRRNTDPEALIHFNGGSHTLYKRNVMSAAVNRWTREVTLREAFARSFNSAFGRLAIEKLEPQDLEEYAFRYGFNRQIQGDLLFDQGVTEIPTEKTFHLTEIASGFNRVTLMSPIQGALMAAVVANDGKMPKVQIMEKVTDSSNQIIMNTKSSTDFDVLSPDGNEKMKALMEETIVSGTSRKSFKHLRRDRRFREVEMGGKTGSLTGNNPRGKTDWFVGYAMGDNGEKLAIAAVTVHVNLWRVKSSSLAQSVVRRHFRDMQSWVARQDQASENSDE
jgi:peptidoglycan glycosyltransferase